MSLKDKLKSASNWTAALLAAGALQSADLSAQPTADNSHTDVPAESLEHLDSRVSRGTLINGEDNLERREKFQKIRAEKGLKGVVDAIENEDFKTVEIPQKTENGYVFETYHADKGTSDFVSYYPNGVLQARIEGGSEKAEGYYPDGSKEFERTADGVETKYHPGGKKGQEKIKETPHKIHDSYDVLDIQGRRTEHHHAVQDSNDETRTDSHSLKDVKTVDLYNPETKKMEATYTLDNWSINKGRLAQIGIVREDGQMKTIDFPKSGKKQGYFSRLTTKSIQKLYDKHQQKDNNATLKKAMTDKLSADR